MNPQSRPILTVFERSPDEGKGLARDMRVRWALEEIGRAYDVRPVSFAALKEPTHRKLQPFAQIPTLEDGDLSLFESGAIVLHIALGGPGLMPEDADARARAITWMFAALSTIEPPILDRETLLYLERDETWFDRRLRTVERRIRVRLGELSERLGDAEWLDGAFSAGDLMTVDVLRRLGGSDLLDEFANLAGYVARAEARPAFRRAFDAQRAHFCARATDTDQTED